MGGGEGGCYTERDDTARQLAARRPHIDKVCCHAHCSPWRFLADFSCKPRVQAREPPYQMDKVQEPNNDLAVCASSPSSTLLARAGSRRLSGAVASVSRLVVWGAGAGHCLQESCTAVAQIAVARRATLARFYECGWRLLSRARWRVCPRRDGWGRTRIGRLYFNRER